MSKLLKALMIRSATARFFAGEFGKIELGSEAPKSTKPAVPESDDFKNAQQILRMKELLLSVVDVNEWNTCFCSDGSLQLLSKKIAAQVNMQCDGLIEQMLRYSYANSPLSNINDDSCPFATMLATILSIFCSSNFQQILILLYGIYDIYDEDFLTDHAVLNMIHDVFLVIDSNNAMATNEEGKVMEIVSNFFDYSEASSLAVMKPKCFLDGGNSNESFRGVSDRLSPDLSRHRGISCETFVRYFSRRRGTLWQLEAFKLKLQQVSFGFDSWKVVTEWSQRQSPGGLAVPDVKFSFLYQTCLSEVSEYLVSCSTPTAPILLLEVDTTVFENEEVVSPKVHQLLSDAAKCTSDTIPVSDCHKDHKGVFSKHRDYTSFHACWLMSGKAVFTRAFRSMLKVLRSRSDLAL